MTFNYFSCLVHFSVKDKKVILDMTVQWIIRFEEKTAVTNVLFASVGNCHTRLMALLVGALAI